MFSIRNQSCPNPRCSFHAKMLHGTVVVHSRALQRFQCTSCKKTWVAHLKDIRYGLKTSVGRVRFALDRLRSGASIRRVAKEVHASNSSVQRWKKKFLNDSS